MANSNSSGVGIMTITFLILVILKLFGVISISWWWVFSPLIIGFAIGVIFLIFLILISRKS